MVKDNLFTGTMLVERGREDLSMVVPRVIHIIGDVLILLFVTHWAGRDLYRSRRWSWERG